MVDILIRRRRGETTNLSRSRWRGDVRVAIVSASFSDVHIRSRGGASEVGKTIFLLNDVGMVNVQFVSVSAGRSTSAP